MQKVVDFLEKHVQWVALGLGVVYVLYILYAYVLTPPVTVEVNGEPMTAKEIDKAIAAGPAANLKKAIDGGKEPDWVVEEFASNFRRMMNWESVPYPEMARIAWTESTAQKVNLPEETTPQRSGALVENLPVLPRPIYEGDSDGRSVVLIPPPQMPNQPRGVAPVEARQEDRDWVSVFFRVPSRELAASFDQAQIPPQASLTTFLRVELVRDEKLPDGTWSGKEVVIQPLPIHNVLPMPQPGEEQMYLQWAVANVATLLQPSFYQWVRGDPWVHFTVADMNNQPTPTASFDPSDMKQTPKTEEEIRLRREWIQEENRRKANERRGAPQPRSGPGTLIPPPDDMGNRRRSAYLVLPEQVAQARPPANPPRRRTPAPEYYDDFSDGMAPPSFQQPMRDPRSAPLPPGNFDPKQQQGDIEIVAHDDTVQPGKTYRYRMRYTLSNPVYGTRNIAANRELEQQFMLVSPPSDWSDEVTIPPRTNFFVVGGIINDTIRMEVFCWQNGSQLSRVYTVSPGDHVGGTENGVDFSTGWTVVDLRYDSRTSEPYALVVNEDGVLKRRELSSDRNDPLFLKLREEVARGNAARGNAMAGQ